MKPLFLLLAFLIPSVLLAQERDNPIDPHSEQKMAAFNKEFITSINNKRATTGLAPLTVSDSLTKLATHYVGLFIGIGEGELASGNPNHYFASMGPGNEITVQDIIKAHWVGSGNGRFPGIKTHYTKMGVASILRKDDLLNYVIFE